jgi:RimJ/RimL family protein N-acetyltransferase
LGKPPVGPADIVVTEQGVARLRGLSLRERAQALIDIAHPQDRAALVEAAKVAAILYSDQIFLSECALDHSAAITADATFKAGLRVRFRPIRPSDEEGMRRLFYRFSKEAVYYRYFAPVAAMPHEKMQAYVNTDCTATLSIVGLVETVDGQTIVAEARYVAEPDRPWAEVAFIVDEALQGRGIGTFVYRLLADAARQRGIKGFTASVLATNKAMLSVFEKGGLAFNARLNGGIYDLTIPL